MNNLTVRVTNDAQEVQDLISQGFAAIECSIGGESLVCDLEMDHHGERSHLESVAIRAYRDLYGTRTEDPRFVVAGSPDADATFAIAALAGLLPHPSVEVPPHLPPHVKASKQRDLTSLAETVAAIDTDPIGKNMSAMPFGAELLLWNALMSFSPNNDMSGVAGVFLWQQISAAAPSRKPLVEAAKVTEALRRQAAETEVIVDIGGGIGYIEESSTWGFDVWYHRREGNSPFSPLGWKHPIILARVEETQAITVGCPNKDVANSLFGEGGLMNAFPHLPLEGWGGREAVGGSPRGVKMSIAQLSEAARTVKSLIYKHSRTDRTE
jgi:hypothetical protein